MSRFAFSRLGKVFGIWKRASQEAEPRIKRNIHELQFLPAVIEVQETPPSPIAKLGAWLVLMIFVTAIAFASIGKTDIVATAQGQIIPSGRSKVIQSLESAVIIAINVKEGQTVKKGDVLIELNPVESRAEDTRITETLLQTQLEHARLQALVDGSKTINAPDGIAASLIIHQEQLLQSEKAELAAQLAALDGTIRREYARIASIKADITRLNTIIPLVKKRLSMQRGLLKEQLTPKDAVLQIEQELTEHRNQVTIQQKRIQESNAALSEAQQQRKQAESTFRRQRLEQLSEAAAKIASLTQEQIKTHERVGRHTLTAPVDGIVQQLAVSTIGGVVTPAQELMQIVPRNDVLQARAMLPNKDRGAVAAGNEAVVKIEAFPFTRYGTLPATVTYVSSDAIQDENLGAVFAVEANLSSDTIINDAGIPIRLSPGMTLTLEIKTGERRIIEFLLTPIIKGFKEAARER